MAQYSTEPQPRNYAQVASSLSYIRELNIFVDQRANSPKIVDIVAVHGLFGHYTSTWISPGDGKKWLRDANFLLGKIPNVKIMSFSYSYQSLLKVSREGEGINHVARMLLWGSHREEAERREEGQSSLFAIALAV